MHKVFNYFLPIFFLVLLCLRIYSNVIEPNYLAKREIFVLLLLCLIFLFNNRIMWCLGMCLFTYGLYSIFGRDSESGISATMIFTESIIYAFPNFCSSNRVIKIVLRLIPSLFYLTAFISFLTNPIRHYYGWMRENDKTD